MENKVTNKLTADTATMMSGDDVHRLISGSHQNPFSILGPHLSGETQIVRAFNPDVQIIEIVERGSGDLVCTMTPVADGNGLFEAELSAKQSATFQKDQYLLRYTKKDNNGTHSDTHTWIAEDPYRFSPVLGEIDEHLISEGSHLKLWETLGSHIIKHENVDGVHFACWAPNATRVSVVGDFNQWDGRCHCMRLRGNTGVWEIFIPGLVAGEAYKYELLDAQEQLLPAKADPYSFQSEHPPKTASVICSLEGFEWTDQSWMEKRESFQFVDKPISIYELHTGSWRQVAEDDNRPLSYYELSQQLIPYVKELGFTHIELMPVSEYPFGGSWGYQPVGLFAPTIRHGSLNEFRAFINACHEAELGVILDWVPGHFPEDEHGLARFDGTALYEHADKREGFHPDWNTLVFNYGRREVSNYLLANALYWYEEHHIDGLRVDAVASMLYKDYSRKEGEWIPNEQGGRENLEAIKFLQRVNEVCYSRFPGTMTIAEESTAFPGVTGMTDHGGLGFGYKWNMGWMNDTLSYVSNDPIYRKYDHSKMSFGLHYAFSENYILPLSHDEVVHGKGSLLGKMPGSREQQFANLRAYLGFMWAHPGKKLIFMGGEFAQQDEWNHEQSLDWHLLDNSMHHGMQQLIKDVNKLLCSTPSLYQRDNAPNGFEWVEEFAGDESLFAWLRHGDSDAQPVLVVSNFTPVERSARRIGVPEHGRWVEKLNTDATHYGGSGQGNLGQVQSDPIAIAGKPYSVSLTVPPLSTLIFEFDKN